MSKPITSVALMMLFEEGRFALNDPIAKYLPDLANLEVARSTADSALAIYSDGTQTRTVGAGAVPCGTPSRNRPSPVGIYDMTLLEGRLFCDVWATLTARQSESEIHATT